MLLFKALEMQEAFLAKFMHDAGAKVVGISDAYGALHDPEGSRY